MYGEAGSEAASMPSEDKGDERKASRRIKEGKRGAWFGWSQQRVSTATRVGPRRGVAMGRRGRSLAGWEDALTSRISQKVRDKARRD